MPKKEGNLHAGHRSRVKEEFLRRGLDSFPEHRVLELLLFYAIPRRDVNPIAHRLMERFGSLDGESLSAAIKALSALSDGERLVGIISHVPELKRQIDKQIVVTKDKVGGSHARIMV